MVCATRFYIFSEVVFVIIGITVIMIGVADLLVFSIILLLARFQDI